MESFIFILISAIFLLWYANTKIKKDFDNTKKSYSAQIEKLQQEITSSQQKEACANSKLSESERVNAELQKQIKTIRKELDFYKNIEADSGNLNAHNHNIEPQRTTSLQRAANKPEQSSAPTSTLVGHREYLSLDNEQNFAFNQMNNSSGNFFITGKAGTGKSFLLDAFRKSTNKSHVVLAPTGIAALNVRGATLHSAFGYYNLVQLDVDMISDSTIRLKSEKRLILKNISTIIIDEISMVRADTFDKIDRILKAINHNSAPFGGKQIFLFGDLFQLPPVAKAQEYDYLLDRYGGVYFFCSDAYKNGNFSFLELTINHRQKDDAQYFSLLNRVRDGSVTQADIDTLNTRVVKDMSVFDRFTTLLPTKAEVETLNKYHMSQLNSTGFTYSAKIVLDKYPDKNHNLESVFPISSSLYLKKGALVMMVANDPEHRWVNGTLGIVSNLSNNSISVAINRRTYDIQPIDFIEQEITYSNGKISYEDVLKVNQYPIVPAYAITIHKSQGQTYQNIVCDIDRCFANGQAYVALSRCASLKGLHLKQHISRANIRVDKDVMDFYHHSLKSNLITFNQ